MSKVSHVPEYVLTAQKNGDADYARLCEEWWEIEKQREECERQLGYLENLMDDFFANFLLRGEEEDA